MSKKLIFLFTLVLCLSFVRTTAISQTKDAQNSSKTTNKAKIDKSTQHNPIPSRWVDQKTKPLSYKEYLESRTFAKDINAQKIYTTAKSKARSVEFCIVVNTDLYSQIGSSLNTYIQDLEADGYGVHLYTALNDGNEEALRQILIDERLLNFIEGAILIGDLAVAWYEMYEPAGWGGAFVTFPMDLYYMDLWENAWHDNDENGVYDDHWGFWGDFIYVGRLMAHPLTLHSANELELINNYFAKNHAYRVGTLRLDDEALAYMDNAWGPFENWDQDVAIAYPNTTAVKDPAQTTKADFVNRIRASSNNRYEHLLLCSHSTSNAHYIYWGDGVHFDVFHNYEIEDLSVQCHFYNLFCCAAMRYTDPDYIGAWYEFQSDYGLISVGTTKTGGMLNYDDFYTPLANGNSYGLAFGLWAYENAVDGVGGDSPAWFFGMVLGGDPTLKVGRFMPEPVCETPLNFIQLLIFSASIAIILGLTTRLRKVINSDM